MKRLMLILALLVPGPISAQLQTSTSEAFGVEQVEPTAIHVAVVQWVSECLGADEFPWEEVAASVDWFVADSITIATPDGGNRRTYGISYPVGLDPQKKGRPIVVTERPFFWNLDLMSHEFLHILIGDPGHWGPQWAFCVMHDKAMKTMPDDPRQTR
jgi:hypothetical protein